MGLFSGFKKLFNKTITILPHQRNDMVSFVKLRRGMLKLGSEIVVDENYNFVIVHYNKVCDVFRPGTHKVEDVTVPKLFKYSKVYLTKKGLFTPKSIKTDAYYVNLNPIKLNMFKTPERIIAYKDGEKVKLKLEGTFTLKVVDSEKVMQALSSDYAIISNKKAMKEIRYTIGFDVSKILNGKKFTLQDYLTNKQKIIEVLNEEINKYLEHFGLEASEFFINTVILPKKNNSDAAKDEVANESNIDIVKLVEERLNSLEESFAKVEIGNSNNNQTTFAELDKTNTYIDKQGDVRINVANINNTTQPSGQYQQNNPNLFSMPYSSTSNTQMFSNTNQVEPKLFEESAPVEEFYSNNAQKEEVIENSNIVQQQRTNIDDKEQVKTTAGEDEIVNNVVDYFVKQKRDYEKANIDGLSRHKVKVGERASEVIISLVNKKTKKCTYCGESIEETAKFCSKCGKSTEELVVCPCCGAKNFSTAKTCCVCKSDL